MKNITYDHPILFLRKLSEKIPVDTRFVFEAYKRVNQNYGTLAIGQVVATLSAAEAQDDWLEVSKYVQEMFNSTELNLGKDYEVGINTRVDGFGPYVNIPCIDFIGSPSKERLSTLFEELTKLIGNENFWIYKTDRSLHAYVETLISPLKYKKFLAVLNTYPDIVDTMWVNHAVGKGHGILRWSAISTHHQSLPTFLEKIKLV